MYAYNDININAHRSWKQIYVAMKPSYYWKVIMFVYIKNWDSVWWHMSQTRSLPKHSSAKLQPIMEHMAFYTLNTELIGPMSKCPQQYQLLDISSQGSTSLNQV